MVNKLRGIQCACGEGSCYGDRKKGIADITTTVSTTVISDDIGIKMEKVGSATLDEHRSDRVKDSASSLVAKEKI